MRTSEDVHEATRPCFQHLFGCSNVNDKVLPDLKAFLFFYNVKKFFVTFLMSVLSVHLESNQKAVRCTDAVWIYISERV